VRSRSPRCPPAILDGSRKSIVQPPWLFSSATTAGEVAPSATSRCLQGPDRPNTGPIVITAKTTTIGDFKLPANVLTTLLQPATTAGEVAPSATSRCAQEPNQPCIPTLSSSPESSHHRRLHAAHRDPIKPASRLSSPPKSSHRRRFQVASERADHLLQPYCHRRGSRIMGDFRLCTGT
jgi:hypothetical protein